MATEQLGIARGSAVPSPPRLDPFEPPPPFGGAGTNLRELEGEVTRLVAWGRKFTATVQGNVRKLTEYQERVLMYAGDVEDRLARRVNEMLLSGTLAERPDAGVRDRVFFATDQASGARVYYDTGTAWVVA